ncbi:MAG: bifunctional hydroxymethylpyrimidine kinase/phosphomethylpyrimidine kinase [Oscillospiraceae bacterium]|nr:bifunctional hydroxymethylpyrimidine kinase/phosphomethylpyrimidine kinase [Oscillospiraceae bacterium]
MSKIVCAGSINIDISASATKPLNLHGKNPGAVVMASPGGVVGNVAEVLARIGHDTAIISTAGIGGFNDMVVNGCAGAGIDVSHVRREQGADVVICTFVNDEKGDLVVMAANPAAPTCVITVDQIKAADKLIKGCEVFFLCPTLPADTIDYIIKTYPDMIKMSDVGSVSSVPKLTPYLPYLHTLKVNEREAAAFAGHPTDTDENVYAAAQKILALGVQNVVITLGDRGAVYASKDFYKTYGIKQVEKVVNTSGAGDSFFAGLMHACATKLGTDEAMEFAAACARLTIQSHRTINPDITMQAVLQEMKR